MDMLSMMWGVSAMLAGVMCFACGFILGVEHETKRVLKGLAKKGVLGL